MLTRTFFLAILASVVCAACGGGGHDRPQSESNLYGYTIEQLAQAMVLRVDGGTQAVRSRGAQTSYYVPGLTTPGYDPRTGQATFNGFSEGYSVPAWYVVIAATSPEGNEVATGWTARTVWVVRGDRMISSRSVTDHEDTAFGTAFINPPFPAEGARAVAEMVRGQEVQLVGAVIEWVEGG